LFLSIWKLLTISGFVIICSAPAIFAVWIMWCPEEVYRRVGRVAFFSEEMAAIVGRDMPLGDALGVMETDVRGALARALRTIRSDLEGGEGLASAMRHSGFFPRQYVAMIEVAERHGVLARVFERVASYHAVVLDFARNALTSFTYPALVAIVMWSVFSGLVIFICPKFEQMFADMGVALPSVSTAAFTVGKFAFDVLFWAMLAAIAAVTVARLATRLTRKAKPRSRVAAALENTFSLVPLYGGYARRVGLARFAQMMHVLLDAGVPLPEALAAAESASPEPLAKRIRRAREVVGEGGRLGAALAGAGGIPSTFQWFVSVGESSNRLPNAFAQLADLYMSQTARMLNTLGRAICPIAILLLGIFDGFVVWAMFSPLIQLTQMIS